MAACLSTLLQETTYQCIPKGDAWLHISHEGQKGSYRSPEMEDRSSREDHRFKRISTENELMVYSLTESTTPYNQRCTECEMIFCKFGRPYLPQEFQALKSLRETNIGLYPRTKRRTLYKRDEQYTSSVALCFRCTEPH